MNPISNKLSRENYNELESMFLEVQPGVGGYESALFAEELSRMYIKYAATKGWKLEVLSEGKEKVGVKEVVMKLKGNGVYSRLRFESGCHRVQRIPATENKGRVHTSVCLVFAFKDERQKQPLIKPSDLRIDTFRASGAGGQHVNKTDSAVRITHLPTGMVVQCQNDRSQHRNRSTALEVLSFRLLKTESERSKHHLQQQKRSQAGTGERSSKIRTYNFIHNRVTDHRINKSFHKLECIMSGNLDVILDHLNGTM